MKRIYLITFSSALLVVLAAFCLHVLMRDDTKQRKITIGFVYVGDAAPELCPVCKVPSWKFEKAEGRA